MFLFLSNNSIKIIKNTPKEINISATLKINQWKSPIWKSIKSGTALYIILSNILLELNSILYAGALSGGIAFTLQMYAQKNIEEAPAAIIYSLEGVFAAIAGWIILDQFLKFNNIIGCFLILFAVILSQILPTSKVNNTK